MNKDESLPKPDSDYIPKTPLFKKLYDLRKKATERGMKPLSWEEIHREVAERRGEELGDGDDSQ